MFKLSFTPRGDKSYQKLDNTQKKVVDLILEKMRDENYLTSKKIAKVKKCKDPIIFRFENGDYRIFFGRNVKEKTIIIYLITVKSGNQTYNKFDCPGK